MNKHQDSLFVAYFAADILKFETSYTLTGSRQTLRSARNIGRHKFLGGLLAYQSLTEEGTFERIRIFERDNVPGGNWHYTLETPKSVRVDDQFISHWWTNDYNPTVPSHVPHKAIHRISGNETARAQLEEERLTHRLPKPVYRELKANTPSPEQQIADFRWPSQTEWATSQPKLQRYLRAFASWLGISSGDESGVVSYQTRVESVTKRFDESGNHSGWKLLLRRFMKVDDDSYEEAWWEESFDAVIIASGRFNIPWIPRISGLAEWQSLFPTRVIHSRQYREPESLKGKTVLVVGASASAVGVAQDIDGWTQKTYLSVRENSEDPRSSARRALHRASVPQNTTTVGEIEAFQPVSEVTDMSQGDIKLVNGTVISGIDEIIFATGYRYSFPFLPQYHTINSTLKDFGGANVDGEHFIVTDGTHVRSLYLDVFYIDQPTLAFQGLNVGVQTFVYGKYTGSAIAKVWSNRAHLPSLSQMWDQYQTTVQRRGGERAGLQWLTTEANIRSLNFFSTWLNTAAFKLGGKFLDLPLNISEIANVWRQARGVVVIGSGAQPGHDFTAYYGEEDLTRAANDDW